MWRRKTVDRGPKIGVSPPIFSFILLSPPLSSSDSPSLLFSVLHFFLPLNSHPSLPLLPSPLISSPSVASFLFYFLFLSPLSCRNLLLLLLLLPLPSPQSGLSSAGWG